MPFDCHNFIGSFLFILLFFRREGLGEVWVDIVNSPFFFLTHWFCLKLLISGSLDSLDVDDLRLHTNYAGGYHSVSSPSPPHCKATNGNWEIIGGLLFLKNKKPLPMMVITNCSNSLHIAGNMDREREKHLKLLSSIRKMQGKWPEKKALGSIPCAY